MDPLPDEAAAVEAGLTGKDPIAAADWLAANAPDADQRLIAAMVVKKLRDMARMGVKFKLTIAQVGDKVPSSLMGARGLNVYTFGQPGANPAEMHVWLNGSTVTGKVGVSYETALHELVHSATVAAIRLANMKVNAGTSIATSVSNLFYVNNAIIREFNKRVAASKAGTYTLTAFEQAILDGNNNAFRDPNETITWALTNREAQKWLESVPYKQSGNLWGALVQAVRSFLGLQAKADTALSEVLQLGQELLEANVNSLAQMAGAVGTNFSINAPAGQIILRNVASATAAVGDHEGGH
jgi:hypothetical protein